MAIIGSPGIGKSCSMNFFLMEFVRHLGEPGWKNVVLVRFDSTFLEISRDEFSGEIQCEESTVSSFGYMNNMLERYWKESLYDISQMVLLLELKESEVDPEPGGISCLALALSARTPGLRRFCALSGAYANSERRKTRFSWCESAPSALPSANALMSMRIAVERTWRAHASSLSLSLERA